MQPDNKDNKVDGLSSTLLLSEEANQIARSRNWTRDFALYIMFCKAMAIGDKVRAETCTKLLEQEVMNALADPVFWGGKRNNQVR